jgi:hypothetical protein
LFRYSQALVDITNEQYTDRRRKLSPHVDYDGVRLWEGLLAMLPWIVEPIPDGLAHVISMAGVWQDWERQVEEMLSTVPDDTVSDLYYDASRWSAQ